MDEITAYWQKALGKTSVLGQASNRPPPRPRAPEPDHLGTKSPGVPAQPEQTIMDASNTVAESERAKTLRSEE